MLRRAEGQLKGTAVRQIDFHRTKYGRELLIDAAFTVELQNFHQEGHPHALSFFDILLITRGRGTFALDGERHTVQPGVMFFTRPGEVREWRAQGVDGACLFFTHDFVREAFSDPHFLDQFAYFQADRPAATLRLQGAQRTHILDRFAVMTQEIRHLTGDAPHLLRAVLYELLVLLNRWYAARYGAREPRLANSAVDRFVSLVERDFRRSHRVEVYARELGLTPGHLNALCREHLGSTAGGRIRQRITLEARRLLLYSDQPAAAVAYHLGFEDPSYFSRFFRRETGLSPASFRAQGLASPA